MDCAALDSDCHSLGEASGYRLPGLREDAAEGLAGDSHLLGGVELWESIGVCEAERFELV